MIKRSDFLVVGAGIAGASAAYELATEGKVTILEREPFPGQHSTGRSAAIFLETYGNAVVRALTHCSRAFFDHPPEGFSDTPLITPRGALFLSSQANLPKLAEHFNAVSELVKTVSWLGTEQLHALLPCLQKDLWVAGVLEPDAQDLDVAAIHQGYLRGFKRRGGEVVTDAELQAATYVDGVWRVTTRAGVFEAPNLINAAGAWADEVARLAGVETLGLAALRRTAVVLEAPAGAEHWPYFGDIAESFYIKPEPGRLLASPCDETPVVPCDARPDEYDVATIADRVETMTTLPVNRIIGKWAGLRTFATDRTPVAGYALNAEGFFWLAGQGGYGIQTAPAMARSCKALIVDRKLPSDLIALDIGSYALSAARFHFEPGVLKRVLADSRAPISVY